MGRWSPTVQPEAPRYVPPMDLSGALSTLADGVGSAVARRDRLKRESEATKRADEDRAYRRMQDDDVKIRQEEMDARQRTLDAEAATDRTLRRESDFVTTRGRARDDGYIDDEAAGQRRTGYGQVRDMGRAMGGPLGMGVSSIGDALAREAEAGESMELTTPQGGRQRLRYDPMQTREARQSQEMFQRDERQTAAQLARARQEAELRPPPRDPVAEHVGMQEYDRKHGVGDFAPRAPRGGSGGGGSRAIGAEVSVADKMYDNAQGEIGRLERNAPKAPDFTMFQGMAAPVKGQNGYDAYKADSTSRANTYNAQAAAHTSKLNAANKASEEWFSLSAKLAREAVGASGGDSVSTQNQISAQREIQQAQQRFNAILSRASNNPKTQDELRQAYFEEVDAINSKYGIRSRPED